MSAPLRVGLITYGLDRPLTGIGRYTVELIRAMEQFDSNFRYILFTMGIPRYLPEEIGFGRYSICSSGRFPNAFVASWTKTRTVAHDLDLQMIHDPTGIAPFAMGVGHFHSVVTIHDTYAIHFPTSSTVLENLITRLWLPIALSRVDKIITVSMSSKQDIIRFLHQSDDKIHVVPNGVGPNFCQLGKLDVDVVLERYCLKPGYILTVSSLNPRRNLKRLLAAYRRLSSVNSLPPLVVVGKARSGEKRDVDSSRSGERVHWLGRVPDEDLPALYNGAGLFVFPSLYEGFGLPPLEAFACGVPVACSQAPALKEVVGDAAVLFDPLDATAIASSLDGLLDDPQLRRQLIERGFSRAREYSWLRTAEMTENVYRSVVENVDVA